MATKKRRRRRINYRNIILAILCLVILVFGALKGIEWYKDFTQQKNMKEEVASIVAAHTNFMNEVQAVQKPENIEQETFDTLKQMAVTDTDFSILDQFNPDERISEDYYDKVMELQNIQGNSKAANLFLHIDEYTEDILEFYLKDQNRYAFVAAYPERMNYESGTPALEEDLSSVPRLLQWDLRWGYYPYGDSDIAIAGCAPTCLSMVISYLNQDPTITPNKVARYSEDNGMYVNGVGTSHALLEAAASNYGVQVEGVGIDHDSVKNALDQGKILILNMIPGTFTRVGHFIVAYGDDNGQLKIHDPNSIERSEKLWNYDDVLNETAAIWAYSKP